MIGNLRELVAKEIKKEDSIILNQTSGSQVFKRNSVIKDLEETQNKMQAELTELYIRSEETMKEIKSNN